MSDIITITPKAEERIKQYLEDEARKHGREPSEYKLRVALQGGGCAGFQYKFDPTDKVEETDTVIKQGDLEIVVDAASKMYIQGSTIDYSFMNGLQVNNPNAKGTCGCGISFNV